jgi:hypothetical protein
VAYVPGDGSGQDGLGEIVEFGRRPPRRRWGLGVLACFAVAAVVTAVVRSAGHQPRPAAELPPAPPPVQVTPVHHPLLGVTAGWELFARGPDDLLRIELAQGRIIRTYVPALETASPDVAFVIDPHAAVIRPFDTVAGYVVPDGGQARPLTGLLADGGPMVPGPAGSQAAWVNSGSPTAPALSLVTLGGRRSGPTIRFQPGGPQVPATAVSDGRGDVLVTDDQLETYDTGPGWDRLVPGTVVAVGPASWLVDVCDPQYRHCRYEVVDTATGSQRAIPGSAPTAFAYSSWPPTGVISPDGSTAAVAEDERSGQMTVHLVDLRTGAIRDLGLGLRAPGNFAPDGDVSAQAMAWSPDGRWLFVAAADGKLVVVNARTGHAESLGVSLPAVEQVAIRS